MMFVEISLPYMEIILRCLSTKFCSIRCTCSRPVAILFIAIRLLYLLQLVNSSNAAVIAFIRAADFRYRYVVAEAV